MIRFVASRYYFSNKQWIRNNTVTWINISNQINWDKDENQYQQLKQLLEPFQAEILAFNFEEIIFGFKSQDDLTQFLLTWN